MNQSLRHFFRRHYQNGKPLILALSGGVDSLLMFALMKELHTEFQFNLHVVHVDHNWRPESRKEAQGIEEIVENSPFSFHLYTLEGPEGGSVEAVYRQKRLKIYRELSKKIGAQAVLLGHHADDQAETVLKRLLEGASVWNCQGMEEVSRYMGTTFWRPFLRFPKKKILKESEKRGLKWIDDWTNRDTKYLRARMRCKMIPQLAETFQKEIASPLVQVGEQLKAVTAYFDERVRLDPIEGPFGVAYDLSEGVCHPVEVDFALKKIFRTQEISPSREVMQSCLEKIMEGAADRLFIIEGRRIFIDRKRLILPAKESAPLPTQSFEIDRDRLQFGRWLLEKEKGDGTASSGWMPLWLGEGRGRLPKEANVLAAPSPDLLISRHVTLGKWFCQHKIPAFFRQKVPVVLSEEKRVVHEFLTGNRIVRADGGETDYRLVYNGG